MWQTWYCPFVEHDSLGFVSNNSLFSRSFKMPATKRQQQLNCFCNNNFNEFLSVLMTIHQHSQNDSRTFQLLRLYLNWLMREWIGLRCKQQFIHWHSLFLFVCRLFGTELWSDRCVTLLYTRSMCKRPVDRQRILRISVVLTTSYLVYRLQRFHTFAHTRTYRTPQHISLVIHSLPFWRKQTQC